MAINSRISIFFDQKELMLIFNRVEDATAYKFRGTFSRGFKQQKGMTCQH